MAKLDSDTIKQILKFCAAKLPDEDFSELEELLNGPGATSTPNGVAALRELQQAQADTREVLGAQDAMAMDSASGLYRRALKKMGIDAAGLAPVALRPIFVATRRSRLARGMPLMAADAAGAAGFASRYPAGAKIGTV